MDINGWLTVVTVFIALIAFLPQHERNLLQIKLPKWEIYGSFILLIILIPYLLLFRKLETRIPILSKMTFKGGFEPCNIAFFLFYLIFLWILTRLFVIKPRRKTNHNTINYFNRIISELPFPQFFSLFLKYSEPPNTKAEWTVYRPLIMNPEFLKGIQQYQSNYVFKFLKFIGSDADFKSLMLPIIKDTQSVYFTEIKKNDGFQSISQRSPFLLGLAVSHLQQSLKLGLRQIVSDSAKTLIRLERGKMTSPYLQEHLYGHMRGEEGYDLPVYYHIRFIALLYSTAIQNLINTHPHMHTIYGGMVEEMVKNLDETGHYPEREFPTNYHWLINEIFGEISNWLDLFGTESTRTNENFETEDGYFYYKDNSTYIDFIPSCFHFTANELFKGFDQDRITSAFIAKIFHYHLFGYYFRHDAKLAILTSIEQNVIRQIPNQLLADIFDKTLDEHFASSYEKFIARQFSGDAREVERQDRLLKFYVSIL